MVSLTRGGFSLRGSKTPPWYLVGVIVIVAFAVGVGAGWLTGVLPGVIRNLKAEPSPSASPEPSAPVTVGPPVPADQYPPIVRAMDPDDALAGLNSLDIPLTGTGNMTPVPGVDEAAPTGITRWVRFEVEEGLPVADTVVSDYMLSILNDPRGWGAGGSQTFARTEGVPEIRFLIVTPQTAAALCERPHDPFTVPVGPVDEIELPDLASTLGSPPDADQKNPGDKAKAKAAAEVEAIPTPTPTGPSPEEITPSCADQGLVVINAYYWAAGVAAFADDRASARAWLINHFVGHYRALPDEPCHPSGKAPAATVMVDHFFDISPCTPQAWPYPDGYQGEAQADG